VPARPTNFDFQQEIHQGLVLNASMELCRAFLQKQMSESFFQITSSEVSLSKKHKWSQDIELILETEQSIIDDFFIDFQRHKKNVIEFDIKIKLEKSKKTDLVKLKLQIEKTELIA
jgi:hypothetical protein